MNIRRATPEDAAILAELNAPVQELHVGLRPDVFKPPDLNVIAEWYRDVISRRDNYVFIGEVDGQAVGYVYALVVRRPENPFTYAMKHIALDQISVNEDQRGKGYGKKLVKAVFELARSLKIDRVVLSVWKENTGGCRFWEKQGFSVFIHRMDVQHILE